MKYRFTANAAHLQFVASVFLGLEGNGGGFTEAILGKSATDRERQAFVMTIFALMVLPLCFKRRLGELRHVSLGVV